MTLTPTAVRVLLLALTLMAAGRLVPGHHARATEIQPLDLAAMVLIPDDLEIHGLTGYGTDYGQYLTTGDYAAGFAREREMDFEKALDIFEAMGLLRGYTVRLALPGDPDDFYSDATEGVHVRILEYDTDASAGAIFDLTRAEIEDGDRDVLESPKEFGDDWVLSRSDVDDPESGDPARDLTLEFRVGNLIALITMFDIARDGESSRPTEPDIDIVEQLGELLLERIVTADSSEQPLLGIQALRLSDENGSVVTVGDRYYALDGSPIRRYAETADAFDTRVDHMAAEEIVAVYGLEQDVRSSDRENAADPHMSVRLYRFGDVDAADEWLEETAYDRFAAEGYAQEIDQIDLSFDLGDASSGASYVAKFGGSDLVGTVVWVQVNDLVARVSIEGADPIGLEVVEELVEAQVNCLQGSPCESLAVPTTLT